VFGQLVSTGINKDIRRQALERFLKEEGRLDAIDAFPCRQFLECSVNYSGRVVTISEILVDLRKECKVAAEDQRALDVEAQRALNVEAACAFFDRASRTAN